MKKIESIISPLVENQFPSFYKEEGPQFIAFVKAYYEWMESANNVLYQSRKLPDYRDIDTTLDEFILQFKEKYLKNIQFDTATNKELLIKNSLDLYRSKGTERSIDLFFKLVYGTSAEVRYPADNIFRASDGVWERPEYLEVTNKRFNVDYVGKQIIGAISGAKAFVEKYIRRRTAMGYVDLLYISGRQGHFTNGELIGLNVNNTPVFDRDKRAKLVGSVSRIIIQDNSRDFKVGDLVTFTGTNNGQGGIARVAEIGESTGIIDFIFVDGGWGYTVDAESIISEKVVTLNQVVATTDSGVYFRLFEEAVQPIVNVAFTSATANLAVGDTVYRYAANGQVSGSGKVIDIDQTGANGTISVSHTNGIFINAVTYYTTLNAISFYANTVEDKTISGRVMGIPETYSLNLKDHTGTLEVGQSVLYKNTTAVVARGVIESITPTIEGNTVVLTSARGAFPIGQRLEVSTNSSISANIAQVDLNFGVYDIRRYISKIKYSTANNNEIQHSSKIYRYDSAGKKVAEGILLTVDHDSGTATGNLTFIPTKGYFTETDVFYTDSNTSVATTVTYTVSVSGGDYVPTEYSRILTRSTNTQAIAMTTSFGSGAGFNVGTLGDSEDIFIGTDLIGANNVNTFDYDRVNLTVGSISGFSVGNRVYQEVSKIAFNASSSVNATSGFITLPTANSRFAIGDIVRYNVDTGNTALNYLIANDYYHIIFSNTTGVILSFPYRKTERINTANFSTFANNQVNEEGHYLYKVAHGTVFETATGVLKVKDNHNFFGNTGGTANVTTYANGNVIKYGSTATNTSISAITNYPTLTLANQAFAALPFTASAYGFPKNRQGDGKNTIYSCLTFQKFTIGTMGSLSAIDPGSDYNVDPYVIAYQPYISAFDRKDFVIDITDAVGIFTIGEKVNQTQANLIYYDLKVDNGAYSNTFDEKVVVVNTKDEVISASDFVLYISNNATFNASDNVNSNTDFISLDNSGSTYTVNTYVRYYTDAGNTALTGLSNNQFYFVAFANTSGITLKSTVGGSNINITQSSNVASFNSNTSVDSTANFISITSANTLFANGDQVRYITAGGNTAVSGLSNNQLYYVRYANSTGLALSLTSGGANVDITALDPGDSGHFLRYYNANFSGHNLIKYENEFADDQIIIYRTPFANTVIDGLANNTAYYIVGSNTIGFQLADTPGGTAKAINATSGSAESHSFSTVPGFLPGDRLYINSSPIVNVTVQSIYSSGPNNYVRVFGNTGTITSNVMFSYSNPYVSANVDTITLYQITSTAKGVVKFANTTTVKVKRLNFENTFRTGERLIGDVSGASANIAGIAEDPDVVYPIGLNADIEANVITAVGSVLALDVVDSGIGYSNGDVLQYTSEDGLRAGSIKVVIDGHGIGKGYYKSSKGFLSEDMYVHDGDYYQEYSYEIFSKISVDRYADMFKKVMHTAGTKFFGSAMVVEEDSATVELSQIATGQEVQFNSATDVSSANETIDLDVPMTSNSTYRAPFANGDIVRYYTGEGNTALEAIQTRDFIPVTNNITSNSIPLTNTNISNSTFLDYPLRTNDKVKFVKEGIMHYFNNSDTYPESGGQQYIAYNNTNISDVTEVYINSMAANTANVNSFLQSIANSGTLIVENYHANGSANVTHKFTITGKEDYTALYDRWHFTVTHVSGTTPFVFADRVTTTYVPTGFSEFGLANNGTYYINSVNSTSGSIKLSTSVGGSVVAVSNVYYTPFETYKLNRTTLANNQPFFIINTSGNTVKLSSTLNGTAINITANTTDTDGNTAGHYLTKIVEE